ncbi:hypothetical protein CANTEDRAFT_128937 [Yamadazyma tenuis ATCC 10573]|uniref:Phospholipid/glycerol acyltransferase domain-containing protein n=3 Tax=Candida tenuis TaxID=2315449 RepID=G3AWH7_CANTC|nr:uncharacterized protein CANTEDRAFT_128937 [Yamadazyma tenuis ATCC 10573]EGV66543.1 hypothetical protein CANTEDRAFT_128937 [Yamadazyma tenuis ATCC 10573]
MYLNPYFDVNILDNALEQPYVKLSIPLPHEFNGSSGSYIDMPNNAPMEKNWSILLNFIDFFTAIDVKSIYDKNEYYFSVNKFNTKFIDSLHEFMDDKLELSDEYLDELIYKLIDQELNLNLITSKQLPDRYREVKKFMVDYYKAENQKNFPLFGNSNNFIKICYITVIKVLKSMFPDGIWCNNLEISRLYQQYLKDPMSIIYLPCHKSHVDYIILHILNIRFQLSTPVVIAGENLNVAVFGKFLKKLGAIFIKRSFNNELYTEKNLTNLLEFFVLNNVNIEVFIEGTRSRDGKLLLPKYGVLKILQQIYDSTKKDMILQPLSITYERIYETDGYLKELIGKDKKQESFLGIIKNGLVNLFGGEVEHNINKIIEQRLEYDNIPLKLNGKIFIKFGQNFHLSACNGNLKQMGFKTLHEVNSINYLPEIAIVGAVIQLYSYLHPTEKIIPMANILRIWPVVIGIVKNQVHPSNESNITILSYLQGLKNDEVIYLIKYQIIKFLKFIKVDTKSNDIIINNSIELLYYKNLSIHLLITKSIISFGILHSNSKTIEELSKVTRTIKTLLKSEFLFDYSPNERDEFTVVINELIESCKIDKDLKVLDKPGLELLESLVYPFIKSYMICTTNIIEFMEPHAQISEELLINDQLNDFPDTKKLLKSIQKNAHTLDYESINKQYLLSCLYYLNHLGLIKIFKNKSKTVAYVKIENKKDLDMLNEFLQTLFNQEEHTLDMDYMVDIIDKTTTRAIKL